MNMKESNKQFDDVKASLHTEALKLAVWLENMSKLGWADNFGQELDEISAMIRRLVEELDKVPEVVFDDGVYRWWLPNGDEFVIVPPSPKPLSDEEIEELREYHGINDWLYETSVIDFARAIEERHGIK